MAVAVLSPLLTLAAYSAAEQVSLVKHHFHHGELIDVAGASYEHNVIQSNLLSGLAVALDDTGCRVLGSDMRIFVSEQVAFYPDVVVVCGPSLLRSADALQNPVLVAEILSPSTAAFDRGEKFRQYRTLASLQHIVFLNQDSPAIEHYARDHSGLWTLSGEYYTMDETLTLSVSNAPVLLSLSRIYRNVLFDEAFNG